MAAEFVAAHPEELERIAETARYRPAERRRLYAPVAGDARPRCRRTRLHRVTAPTLVIHGELDPLVPPPNGANLAAKIAGARQIVYHGVGHIPIIERADEFNRDVLAFLNGDA